MGKPYTKTGAFEAVAKSLREFGYEDTTADMVKDIGRAFEEGRCYPNLPHDIIGGFAESQLLEVAVAGRVRKLPDL